MKRLIYQVYMGQRNNLYDTCVDSVKEYAKKYNITHVVQRDPILKIKPDISRGGRSSESIQKLGYLPIYEKENAFSYIDKYDQIAIIDSDIYIKNNAPNIFEDIDLNYAFGAVLERDMPNSKKQKSKVLKYSNNSFKHFTDVKFDWNQLGADYYNMGLMLINSRNFAPYLNGQTPSEFFKRPEFKDFIDGIGYYKWSTDQILLNWWIKKENIKTKNLDWRWNGLYRGIETKYLNEVYFVHFFLKDLLPNRGENIKELLTEVYK
jgi:lipopolysaccharide biosynthesis glycosyltransferase